jgi:hypothetical protein
MPAAGANCKGAARRTPMLVANVVMKRTYKP